MATNLPAPIGAQSQAIMLPQAIEAALIGGDLSGLNTEERMALYRSTCQSLGLNPLTKPFQYLTLKDPEGGRDATKLVLYATKDCTDQLRNLHGVSVRIASREVIEGVYVVTASGSKADGRVDESTGAVPLVKEDGQWKTNQQGKRYFESHGTYSALAPDARANAMMKAETKAKRRLTLSLCGLGMIDESEIETIPNARTVELEEPRMIAAPAVDAELKAMLDRLLAGASKDVLETMKGKLCETLGDDAGVREYRSCIVQNGVVGEDGKKNPNATLINVRDAVLCMWATYQGAKAAPQEIPA